MHLTLADLLPHASTIRPTGEAIIGLTEVFTWPDVECRTRRLAGLLVSRGIEPGDRVAVLRPKGHESFEAVHAILRAGGIVVPVDPFAPPAAVTAVLTDAGATGIVGHGPTIVRSGALDAGLELRTVLSTGSTGPAGVPVEGIDELDTLPDDVSLPSPAAEDPAYLIYTSGSTGTPKGILHTHASAMAYARLAVVEHGLAPTDRLAAMTGLHFDMSTLELYAIPLAGASVVQMSEPHLRFPASFTQRAADTRTTIWYAVTFLLQQILERGALHERDWGALRSVLFAGEVFPVAALRDLMAALPRARFENVYGPAEVNACNVFHLDHPPAEGEPVPVGPAVGDAVMRVVDDQERAVPSGEKGVLWVSASTRMREYWNRPDLTEVTRRPRDGSPDWYVTGDVVTMSDDGVVWFHGRADHQVKLRGVRVELEGVESTLCDHPTIRHAVVGPNPVEPGTLAAAVVLADGAELDVRGLQRWAAKRLPAVAVPGQVAAWPHLPTTPSGKIDRKHVRAHLGRTEETT